MNDPRSSIRLLALALVVAAAVACADREPPHTDDHQQRQDIEQAHSAVHDGIADQRSDVDAQLDEAYQRVVSTGAIGYPEVDIDELLDDDGDL